MMELVYRLGIHYFSSSATEIIKGPPFIAADVGSDKDGTSETRSGGPSESLLISSNKNRTRGNY